MGYKLTRPDADQIKFTSSKTGLHVLENYMEDAEKGNRTVGELLDDLFHPDTGVLRTLATPAEVQTAIDAAADAQEILDEVILRARPAVPLFYGLKLSPDESELIVTAGEDEDYDVSQFECWIISEGISFVVSNNNLVVQLA
jgi:hypothetical protein